MESNTLLTHLEIIEKGRSKYPEIWKIFETDMGYFQEETQEKLDNFKNKQHKLLFLKSKIAIFYNEQKGQVSLLDITARQFLDGDIVKHLKKTKNKAEVNIFQNIHLPDMQKIQPELAAFFSKVEEEVVKDEIDMKGIEQSFDKILASLPAKERGAIEKSHLIQEAKMFYEPDTSAIEKSLISNLLKVHFEQEKIEWLKGLIDELEDTEPHENKLNYKFYNEILGPIETDSDPRLFVKALEFFCNTKKANGEFFLSKEDIEKLKEIGHRLPMEGKLPPLTFKLGISRKDKEFFYGFFYIAWSKFFPKNRGKIYYALYIKTYFKDFKDLEIASIQSAIKMPSTIKKAKIDSFFDASFQKN